MADIEQTVIDLLCGELQTSWSYCDPSCVHCKFYHEESDMGARVSICVHGFGSSKESCDCYMTQHEYLEFVRSGFANLKADNAELRERMDRLLTLLRDDCGIDASWDGLRKFWSVELTEDGCLMRDRACKAEAENAKLRAMRFRWQENDANLREENDRLRELVRAFDWCTENFDVPCKCDNCPLEQSDKLIPECEVRMRELGIKAKL